MSLKPATQMNRLVDTCRRTCADSKAYIEISAAGLVVRLYPARARWDDDEDPELQPTGTDMVRMRQLAAFVLALARHVDDESFTLHVHADVEKGILVGVTQVDGVVIWLPAEIEYRLLSEWEKSEQRQPSVRFSIDDEKTVDIGTLRRIRLQ